MNETPRRCLMLVDTPIRDDRRVRACIEAYEGRGISVEALNVKWAKISAADWLRAAPAIAWFLTVFTIRWYLAALLLLPRYRYMWRARDLARYKLRLFNLPELFWYETSAHLARGVAWAQANRKEWGGADFIHAHDLAALSFAQYLMKGRLMTSGGARQVLTYDAHELSAFRNRPGLSWLAGLLITAFEARSIRRTASHVISVSPFILTYMRFFAGKAARFHLVVNDFYAAKPIVSGDAPDDGRFAIVYIGSIIRGRGLARLIKSFEATPDAHIFLYSPEDNLRQRGFGEAYEGTPNVTVRYGPYDEAIARDIASFARIYGWVGVEDICLSYRYALPNKLFQYMKFGIALISNTSLYAFDLIARSRSGQSQETSDCETRAAVERPPGYHVVDPIAAAPPRLSGGYKACVSKTAGE